MVQVGGALFLFGFLLMLHLIFFIVYEHSGSTLIEMIGPVILYVCICIIFSLFAFNRKRKFRSYHDDIWVAMEGFDSHIENWERMCKIIDEVALKARERYSTWHYVQSLFSLIMPLPFAFLPFISRLLTGKQSMLTMFDVFFQISGNLLNYIQCVLIIFLLSDLFYVLWEKSSLMKHVSRQLENIVHGIRAMNEQEIIAEITGWSAMRLTALRYAERDFRSREGILQGVSVIFLIYIVFSVICIIFQFQATLDGRNVFLFTVYCVFVIGVIFVYPIMDLGVKINAARDDHIKMLRDLTYVATGMRYADAAAVLQASCDYVQDEPHYFTILMITVNSALLKSVGTIAATSLVGLIQGLVNF
jgi:hypothetical protein